MCLFPHHPDTALTHSSPRYPLAPPALRPLAPRSPFTHPQAYRRVKETADRHPDVQKTKDYESLADDIRSLISTVQRK